MQFPTMSRSTVSQIGNGDSDNSVCSVESSFNFLLQVAGAATLIRLPLLASELERVPHNVELHVDFEHLNHIDHGYLDLLMNWPNSSKAPTERWSSIGNRCRRTSTVSHITFSKPAEKRPPEEKYEAAQRRI